MCCYHRFTKVHRPSSIVHRLSSDDRGVAAIEGLLVFALLAGVILGVMLLGQWGTYLQTAQMGARLLAFNAGDSSLAKLGKSANHPVQTLSSKNWDTLAPRVNAAWLHKMYTVSSGDFLGSVTGKARGRLPVQPRYPSRP